MVPDPASFNVIGPLPFLDFGFTTIPTYYLILSLTYCVGILWFYMRCEQRNLPLKNAMDISLIVLVFGFIGARLTHVVLEQLNYYLDRPIEILYFWQGGFVFYGGALLAYLTTYLYARRLQITFWLWHDTIAPVLAFGYATGRLACYFAGCCYGDPCPLPWAVPLQQVDVHTGVVSTVLRHPTQLYASFFEFGILIFLLWYEKRKPQLGRVFLYWVKLHCIGRLIMELFRDDPRGPEILRLSVSAMISLVLFAIASAVLISQERQRSRTL